jgi:hypothetical protein
MSILKDFNITHLYMCVVIDVLCNSNKFFRQYYIYVTDPKCKRVGTQCWVYGAIMTTESMLCIKNGKELFGQAQVCNVLVWLIIQIFVSIACVYGVVLYHWYKVIMILIPL